MIKEQRREKRKRNELTTRKKKPEDKETDKGEGWVGRQTLNV